MKASEIVVGCWYSDGKDGVREVISISSESAPRVKYAIQAARHEHDYCNETKGMVSVLGNTSTCDLTSFSRWAKERMTMEDGLGRIQELRAWKLRLTASERAFLDEAFFEAGGDISVGTLVQFDPSEARAVKGLERKSIVVKLNGEVEITPTGAAWFRAKARMNAS